MKPGRRYRFVLLWLMAALLAAAGATAEVIDRIVAVVGNRVILLTDVRAALALGLVPVRSGPDAEEAAVRALVERALMLDEVVRYGPDEPAPADVDQRVAAVEQRLGGLLEQTLAQTGIDTERLRAILRDDLRLERYLDQRFSAAAQPTDDEVSRYYAEHRLEFARGDVVPPLADVAAAVRERLTAQRRAALIDDWVDSLRRRSDVSILYARPDVTGPR